MLLPDARPRALYSKGVHIVVEERSSQNALFLSAGNDGRIFFIIPYHGRSLVGTTDSAHHGPPAEIRVEGSDIDYLVRASRTALARPIDPSEIISSFAGVRTLINGQGTLSDISREELIWEEPHGVIHVLGGKLTTFRRIAQRMIKMAAQRNKCPTDDGKLSTTTPFPEDGLSMSAVDQPLNLKATDYEHAVNHLHVKTARDLARRRLPIVLVRKLTPSERLEIAQGLGNFLDWSPGEVNRQAESLAQNHE
jgi:glycerol-3-phosphate dehydrogenase